MKASSTAPRIGRYVHALAIAAAVLAAPLPGHARAPTRAETAAAEAAARAQGHFAEQEWDLAVEALVEAYALDPDPAYLYARAQAERMRGRCKIAIALYERFVESGPSEAQVEDTRINIRRCEETLWAERTEGGATPTGTPDRDAAETDAPSDTSSTPEPEAEPAAPADEARPWQRDPAGAILLSGSVVALAAGATVWVFGARGRRSAPEAETEGDYESEASRGRTITAVGIALVGVGAGLAAGAALRYGLLARGARETPAASLDAVAPMVTPRSLGVAARVRF